MIYNDKFVVLNYLKILGNKNVKIVFEIGDLQLMYFMFCKGSGEVVD